MLFWVTASNCSSGGVKIDSSYGMHVSWFDLAERRSADLSGGLVSITLLALDLYSLKGFCAALCGVPVSRYGLNGKA